MNPDRLSEGQGSNKNPLVDLRGLEPEVRDLVESVGQLTAEINSDHCHTAAPTQAPRRWRLGDRFGEQVIGDLLRDRHAGATHRALAERYGISVSSAKRVLRRHRR
jgi:hypothetical protein